MTRRTSAEVGDDTLWIPFTPSVSASLETVFLLFRFLFPLMYGVGAAWVVGSGHILLVDVGSRIPNLGICRHAELVRHRLVRASLDPHGHKSPRFFRCNNPVIYLNNSGA